MRTPFEGYERNDQGGRHTSKTGRASPGSRDDLRASFPDTDLTLCEVPNWIHLHEGDRVVVQRGMERPKAGSIDILSEETLTFWVWLDRGEGRILVSAQEDVNVWQIRNPAINNDPPICRLPDTNHPDLAAETPSLGVLPKSDAAINCIERRFSTHAQDETCGRRS